MSPQGDDRPPKRPEGSKGGGKPAEPKKPGSSGGSGKPEKGKKPEYTVYGRSGRGGQKRSAPKRKKPAADAGDKGSRGGKGGKPPYTVYRSRPSVRDRFRKSSGMEGIRGESGGGGGIRGFFGRFTGGKRPWIRWILIFAVGWLLLSFITFAISAQIQKGKLPQSAKDALKGGPAVLAGQNILILGGDRRGKTQHNANGAEGEGPPRADTIMVLHASLTSFKKLSIPRDSYAEIPGQAPQKINGAYAFGGAALQIKSIEQFLDIEIDHVAIVDFTGFEDLIDAVGGVEVDLPHKLCADIAGGSGGGQGGVTLHLKKGENTLDGEKALAYSRIRKAGECPGPGKSAFSFGYDDFDREKAQQAVINGIKGRLTDPLRAPYNFIKGPIIGWSAPKAFVSDMGFLTMPQLILAAAIGGSAPADVLCAGANTGCGEGPESSIEVPEAVRRQAVNRFLDG
jgi:LCP family protein required for cell wall assembly